TMLYVLIFGLIQSLLWVTVDVLRTRYMHEQFDRDLTARTRLIAEALTAAADASPEPVDANTIDMLLQRFDAPDLLVEVRTADGRPMSRSRLLEGRDLPFDSSNPPGSAGAPKLESVSEKSVRPAADEGPLRVATIYHQ